MKWLEDNFGYLDDTSNALEKEQHVRAFILRLVNDVLMPDKSRNLVHLRWLLKLIDLKETDRLSWGCRVGHIVLIDVLGGGCILILQSWAWYRLSFLHPQINALYTFPLVTSHVGLPEELEDIQLLLDQRPKDDHMKVPLIVYAKVEVHESDRGMRQFEFRQTILPSPQDIELLYKVDLRGRIDEDWPTFHGQYINIWRPLSTTCHGLNIMANHIFCLRRQ
ncbi:hypothetical protein PVK06_047999 [Gossypium arboreum]|uniref:Uncharacterized protein n=1 Tax=Gossypium arboreum TaxID=29729 RepID=A0ABR0MF84_GOSAR|nr:hypothetical protein PVK06_047999 [Gossypium arboreum]